MGGAGPGVLGYGWTTEADVAGVAVEAEPGGPPSNGEWEAGMSSSRRTVQVPDATCAGRSRRTTGPAVG